MEMYPLKSVPVYKHRIWGGRRLADAFGKDLPPEQRIGESWEIADLPEGKSTIANGELQGRTLGEVVGRYTEQVTGSQDFPERFPLLIKLLDAQDVLSVQVHPDAATCRRMGQGDPKTECWYIIDAEPDAVIYKGFKEGVTKEQFARAIEDGRTAELLARVPVQPGECHFLPAGTADRRDPDALGHDVPGVRLEPRGRVGPTTDTAYRGGAREYPLRRDVGPAAGHDGWSAREFALLQSGQGTRNGRP